ncbi:MAG: hypothetical protein Q7S60_03600 [bacterium]|nr:hypothetical protein [bacterium]
MKKIISSLGTAAALLLSSTTAVFADETISLTPGGSFAGLQAITVPDIVSGVIKILVIAAAILFFVWLVLGGIRWIISGGDKAKTEEARNQITSALVGLVVVFSAWAIAQLIKTLFGFDLFNLTINAL